VIVAISLHISIMNKFYIIILGSAIIIYYTSYLELRELNYFITLQILKTKKIL